MGSKTLSQATPSQMATVIKNVNKVFQRVGIYLTCNHICFKMRPAKKRKKGQAGEQLCLWTSLREEPVSSPKEDIGIWGIIGGLSGCTNGIRLILT